MTASAAVTTAGWVLNATKVKRFKRVSLVFDIFHIFLLTVCPEGYYGQHCMSHCQVCVLLRSS